MSVPETSLVRLPADSADDTRTHAGSAGGEAEQTRPLPVVPGYTVVRWLGGGGMGDVYEVVSEKLGITFALKMVRADRASPAFATRFHQEVRAMMSLDHPNVARIFHHNEADGRPYFTMRFVDGGTLADRLAELRADPRAAVRLLLKVIHAVEYLHRKGQVHRDLKPTNILLDRAGEPYLSDFGLVKDLTDFTLVDDSVLNDPQPGASTAPDGETLTAPPIDPARAMTRTGARIGTYAYMSPEQAAGDVRRVGPASDVWALGVILYELLTGRRPDRDIPPPPPGVDPELDRIVGKCLSADLAERYPSAARLADDLQAWLTPTVPARRRRWPAVALALAVVFVAGGLTLAMLRKPKEQEPDEWRAWARRELQAGRPVTLVDGEGNPAPGFRFVAGGGPAKAERDPTGVWGVHTTGSSLGEFLADPGIDAFTLAGEFRGDLRAGPPRVGLYVASRRVPVPGGNDWHYQLEYWFKESPLNVAPAAVPPVPPPPPGPKTKVYAPVGKRLIGDPTGKREVRYHGGSFDGKGDNPEGGRSWTIEPDRPAAGGPWRTLAVRARGDTFAVAWDGGNEFSVPKLEAGQLDKLQNRGVFEWPDPPLRFTARGGLGVIVEGGSAAVRNLTITPSP